ncbi:carboxy-S-adenosyl-L-methionine synthase CmoA, partial [Campylobacter upsaliensis]|nr:carboxy-S-adenosyl-L-methionine synthase CmoA [Campylobacter upsaliensis]
MKDELFKQNPKKQFEFDASVASVFDDMIERSVPFYKENLELGVKILSKFLKKEARLCDLGCSSANFLLKFFELRKDVELSG